MIALFFILSFANANYCSPRETVEFEICYNRRKVNDFLYCRQVLKCVPKKDIKKRKKDY